MIERTLLVALLVVGCEGEKVGSARDDDAGRETATNACEDVPGNVVPNGSFEQVVGDNVAGWTDSTIVPASGDADHCERYAKLVNVPAWGALSQQVAIDAPAGATLEYGMSVRVLDDDYSEVGLFLVTHDDTQTSRPLRAVSRDKTWVRISGSLTLTAPVTSMTIGVGTNVPRPRSIAVDRVWLVRR